MPATKGGATPELSTHLKQVKLLSEKLLARLAARAAYAGAEEYEEIRELMSALRGLGATPKT